MDEENSELMEQVFLVLRTVFKHKDFKSALQRRVVEAVISGVFCFEDHVLQWLQGFTISGL